MMLSTRAMGGDGFGRSTLEVMLDAIRQRDELPKDLPPALPARPTSRGRLPTSRRSVSVRPNHEASDPGRNDKDVVPKSGIIGSNKHMISECTGLEDDAKNQTMQAILWVQKNFRGLQARSHLKQLKAAATNLQSFVRGERERQKFVVSIRRWSSAIVIQKHVRRWSARAVFNGQLRDATLLQSAIRGWLARQQFIVSSAASKRRQMSNLIEANMRRESTSDHVEVIKNDFDTNNEQSQIYHALVELRSQLLKTEAALQEKEEENAMLKQRLQEYDIRWSNYESKMKSMEATWQGQLNSLQMNFAAARKSHALEEKPKQNRRRETPKPNHYCNSEAPSSSSAEVQPLKDMLSKFHKNSSSVPMRNHDTAPNSVVQLMEEFDQQREIFDNNAGRVAAGSRGLESAGSGDEPPKRRTEKLAVEQIEGEDDRALQEMHPKQSGPLRCFGLSKPFRARRIFLGPATPQTTSVSVGTLMPSEPLSSIGDASDSNGRLRLEADGTSFHRPIRTSRAGPHPGHDDKAFFFAGDGDVYGRIPPTSAQPRHLCAHCILPKPPPPWIPSWLKTRHLSHVLFAIMKGVLFAIGSEADGSRSLADRQSGMVPSGFLPFPSGVYSF